MPELILPTAAPSAPTPPVANAWDEEVTRVAATHGLTDYLPAAIRIVEEACPPGSVVRLRVQWEPEDGSSRVILCTNVPVGAKEASACFERILDRWTVELPIHVRTHVTFTIYPV